MLYFYLKNTIRYTLGFYFFLFICSSQVYAQEKVSKIIALENQLLVAKQDTNKILLLFRLAKLQSASNPQKSLDCSRKAIALARDLDNDKFLAQALYVMSKLYIELESYEQAIPHLQEAYTRYQNMTNKESVADCLNQLALIHIHLDKNKALEYIKQANIVTEDADYQRGVADTRYVQGRLLLLQNEPEKALEKYQKVVEYYEQTKENPLFLAEVYHQIAKIYEKQKEIDKALIAYQKTLSPCEEAENKPFLAKNLMAIARIYQEQKKDDNKALEYYFQSFVALKDCEAENSQTQVIEPLEGIVRSFNNLSNFYKEKNDTEKNDEYKKLSDAYAQKLNEAKGIRNLTNAKNQFNTTPINDSQRSVLLQIEKQKLVVENLAKNRRISYLEAIQNKARLQIQEDSVRLLQKTIVIADLQKEKIENILQINSLKASQSAKEVEFQKQKNIQWVWIAALAAFFIILAFIFGQGYYKNKKIVDYHKNKILLSNQRINRQEAEIRDNKEVINKKDKELASTISQLDEAKQKHFSITQMIAEDLQEPLTDLVEKTDMESVNRLLVNEASRQMLYWVTDILEVNKLDGNNKITLFKENLSVYKTAKEAIENYNTLLKEKQIYVENNIKPFFYASYDRQIIEKILLNFLSNAIKYAPNKGGIIKLDATPTKDSGKDYLKITIQDNGTTIPENILPLVFEKYAPEEARPIGLSLVYNRLMIEEHGGQIGVNSTEELGTIFYFTLQEAKSMEDLDYSTLLTDKSSTTKTITPEEIANKFNVVETEIRKGVDEKNINPEATNKTGEDITLGLTEANRQYLKPYLFELARLDYYEITAVKVLLSKIQAEEPAILEWKKSVEQAIYYLDEKKFNKLTRV